MHAVCLRNSSGSVCMRRAHTTRGRDHMKRDDGGESHKEIMVVVEEGGGGGGKKKLGVGDVECGLLLEVEWKDYC